MGILLCVRAEKCPCTGHHVMKPEEEALAGKGTGTEMQEDGTGAGWRLRALGVAIVGNLQGCFPWRI